MNRFNLTIRKLWIKIALILIAMVTIPVVILGILLIDTSQQAVRQSVLTNHKEIAVKSAEQIELFMVRAYDLLNTTSSMLGVLAPAPFKQETILVELVLNQPMFIRASSVDLTGKELASSELGRGLNWHYPDEALTSIFERKNYLSEVKLLDNFTPFVTMAVAIKRLGKIDGMLIADVNLRGIWDMVDSIELSDTSQVFLVASDGTLIAHKDKKRVLKKENLIDHLDIQAVLKNEKGAIELSDETGKKWISAYAPIRASGWGIVLRETQNTAYIFSQKMRIQSWIIIFLSAIIAILVSIFIAHLVTRPLTTLISKMRAVSGGNLDEQLAIDRQDELGELMRTFNHMIAQLKIAKERERLSAIGEAASRMAHELKNSLVAIKAFIQLFPHKHKEPQFVSKFSTLIPPEINRWERMLKEISEFSKQNILTKGPVKLDTLIKGVLEILKEQYADTRIEIKTEFPTHIPLIDADAERLKQVFFNLIINALQAMGKEGILTLSLETSGETSPSIEIRIKDTGKGIKPEHIAKVFEPFYTSRSEGMGLGLAISKKIIDQHGGEIEVTSTKGEGTTFTITLPVNIV
ncbi:MAG: HAMP domain-containing protein [Candidatus Omnitrophica bacterium]|nr:HAMP domain-containing protein [Candidatus Omnitrophota bacterium]